MELHAHSHSHHWVRRTPDWRAAAVAGFAAGAILMVLELFWSAWGTGGSPWEISHMIAAIVAGPGSLGSPGFDLGVVALALVTHYVLGIAFGLVLAAVMAPFRLDSSAGMALTIGGAFGVLLYLVNFFVLAAWFPWFAEIRGAATLIAHLIFGMSAAFLYWKLERDDTAL
ncbi:hypothetical protein M8A51_00775 [Schlegelella sp. S2-27]|uniref:Sodium:proline symporter n=1 Tax=Caldimonas mangrovi TaxID=2944811 RepID=A0ABT0YIM4_9BURK|nr:hypothetical protein [Caldimonas mangrovi]MCM5678062.1 hypothetical protein [Caldimonas mangrovi]